MHALVQTLEELGEELAASRCLAALDGPRLVGAVRAREQDGVRTSVGSSSPRTCRVAGSAAASCSRRRLGTLLPRATLFTGHRSAANLRLYRRAGYVDSHRETLRPGLELVHLVKDLG